MLIRQKKIQLYKIKIQIKNFSETTKNKNNKIATIKYLSPQLDTVNRLRTSSNTLFIQNKIARDDSHHLESFLLLHNK